MNVRSLTRRSAFRIALLFAGLVAAVILSILAALYYAISDDLAGRVKGHVDELRTAIFDIERTGNFASVTQIITTYAADAEPEEDIFLLTDANNNYIAGNIQSMPLFDGWRTIPWQKLALAGTWNPTSSSTAVVGRWMDVKGGHVFVAGGNGDVKDVQNILIHVLSWSVLFAVASALLGGLILGRSAQKRIGAMETALNAVVRGELDSRVPRSASGDDLDHVAGSINKTLDRLQSLIANLKQITSDIAHDLKSPIGRALQKLDSVDETSHDISAYRDTIEAARTDLRATVGTFEALLRIAEIEGGARKSRFRNVDLKSILVEVVDILETVAEDSGHQMAANLTTPFPAVVRGDKELLTQLFINLVENAIRHCPIGAVIAVNMRTDDGHPIVTISDNGPGIPASEHDKVFRRLYRLEKSRTTPGSGLGLSMVAAIAELHDAQISLADNKPGLIITVKFAA